MKNVEEILVSRILGVMRLFRLRSRYIAVQEKVCTAMNYCNGLEVQSRIFTKSDKFFFNDPSTWSFVL